MQNTWVHLTQVQAVDIGDNTVTNQRINIFFVQQQSKILIKWIFANAKHKLIKEMGI